MTGFFGPGDPRGPVHRIDLTRLLSGGAREIMARAAQEAAERGDTDLDATHILLACARTDTCACLQHPGR